MKKFLRSFCLGVAAALFSAIPAAHASSVFIQPDGTYCSYRHNKTVDEIHVKENKLMGRAIPKGEAFLPKGTTMEIVLPYHLHSRHIEAGDMVAFKLKEDLLVNDVVIAPAGTNVWAEVLYSIGSWGWGHGGELDMLVKGFKTYNGVVVPLNLRIQKRNSSMDDLAIALGYNVLGSLFHGASVKYREGDTWIAQVQDHVDLHISLENLEKYGIYYGLQMDEMETGPSLTMDIRVPKEFSNEYTRKYEYRPPAERNWKKLD
ncbi:MAG: hypothetical protein IJT01_14875 [Selenomonadaceae bacterium]|nr:hypothetical protein [Selenomonadaceae bacterium]